MGGKCQTAVPVSVSPVLVPPVLVPPVLVPPVLATPVLVGSGAGVGWFDSTVQWAGATTSNVNTALRSGCSKFA